MPPIVQHIYADDARVEDGHLILTTSDGLVSVRLQGVARENLGKSADGSHAECIECEELTPRMSVYCVHCNADQTV